MAAIVSTIPAVIRRFGRAYGVYVAVISSIIVFGANDMVGAGRYAMSIFPAAALLGICLDERRVAARWAPRRQWCRVAGAHRTVRPRAYLT